MKRLWDGWENGGWTAFRSKRFYSSPKLPDCLWGSLSFQVNEHEGGFPKIKQPSCEAGPSPSSIGELKNILPLVTSQCAQGQLFLPLFYYQILLEAHIKEAQICSMHGRNHKYFWLKNLKGRKRPLRRPWHRWEDNINMKKSSRNRVGGCGHVPLTHSTHGWVLWKQEWTFQFSTIWQIFWVDKQLSEYKEKLSCMALVNCCKNMHGYNWVKECLYKSLISMCWIFRFVHL